MKEPTVMRGKIMPKAKDSKLRISLQEPETPTLASISREEALARFLLMKKAQGVRERTINDYRRVVTLFFRRFPDAFKDEKDLSDSVYQHMAQEIGPNTYNLRLIYLKVFFNWCMEEKILQKNPLTDHLISGPCTTEPFKRSKNPLYLLPFVVDHFSQSRQEFVTAKRNKWFISRVWPEELHQVYRRKV